MYRDSTFDARPENRIGVGGQPSLGQNQARLKRLMDSDEECRDAKALIVIEWRLVPIENIKSKMIQAICQFKPWFRKKIIPNDSFENTYVRRQKAMAFAKHASYRVPTTFQYFAKFPV